MLHLGERDINSFFAATSGVRVQHLIGANLSNILRQPKGISVLFFFMSKLVENQQNEIQFV